MVFGISTWFSKKDSEVSAADKAKWSLGQLKPLLLRKRFIPSLENYSLNFKGVDHVVLFSKDSEQDPPKYGFGEIRDKKTIKRLVHDLKFFPKDGEKMKKMGPREVIQVIGLKDKKAVAFVEFHSEMLKAENTAFYSSGDKALLKKQKDLYNFVSGHLTPYQMSDVERKFIDSDFLRESKYSQNFEGAEAILLEMVDPKTEVQNKYGKITDSKSVKRIIEILKTLPNKGDLMVSWPPVRITQVVAVKDGKAFAHVSIFSDSALKTESTGFIAGGEAEEKLQEELSNIVKAHL